MTIWWASRAERELAALDGAVRSRVLAALERFANTGAGDVKRLKGEVGTFRLRVGDWRIIFALDAAREALHVQRVANRREAYR